MGVVGVRFEGFRHSQPICFGYIVAGALLGDTTAFLGVLARGLPVHAFPLTRQGGQAVVAMPGRLCSRVWLPFAPRRASCSTDPRDGFGQE